MVGINGIGGAPEQIRSERPPAQAPAPKPSEGTETDGLVISSKATEAATLSSLIAATEGQDEIREEVVAEVRQRIEDGAYELQEVVVELASRISKFIERQKRRPLDRA